MTRSMLMTEGVAGSGRAGEPAGADYGERRADWLALSVIGVAIWLTGAAFASGVTPVYAADAFATLNVGAPDHAARAPDFTLPTLAGDTLRLSDLQGKVVLLNFWATWCKPCREEMPGMQRLWERHRDDGVVVMAVATSSGGQQDIASFVSKLGLTYPVVLDPDGAVGNVYQVVGLPTSYLIGRDGRVAGRISGIRQWDSADADALLLALLARH